MVDVERIERLAKRVRADLGELSGYRKRRDELLADVEALAAVKYWFITAIEGCVRIAQHVIAAQGWPPGDTNADAIRRLAQRGVIDPPTGESVGHAVGFRNILIHEYLDCDDNEVIVNLDRLDDLRGFITQVAGWAQEAAAH
jgi:uncharacterized protein YutE (UPF0331/DUF86 family)